MTRLARGALGRRAGWLLREVLARGAHEQIVAGSENPIMVPSPATVRGQVWAYFEAAHRYEGALHGLGFRLEDPDWYGDPADEQRLYVDPARAAAEQKAIVLIESLATGGRPPWRWTVQRWTRHLAWWRWYLRERQWRPERRRPRVRDPWADAPLAGSSGPGGYDNDPPF